MRILRGLIWGLCLWSSMSCTAKPVVLPDSHQLKPGISCPGQTDRLEGCAPDPGYAQISKGYLRDILDRLKECPHP